MVTITLTETLIGVSLAVAIFSGIIVGIAFSYWMVRKGKFKWTKE
jgi:putative flippase GtrA